MAKIIIIENEEMAERFIHREELEPTEAERIVLEATRELGITLALERTTCRCPTCGQHFDMVIVQDISEW